MLFSDTFQAHALIKASGLPNFMQCIIQFNSHLNLVIWSSYQYNYWEQQLVDPLRYGFSIDFGGIDLLGLKIENQYLPNFMQCRIQFNSHLNLVIWSSYQYNYWEQQLVDPLRYGFSIDFGGIDLLGLKIENQYFLNLSVPYGYQHGSRNFQCCTNAIRFIVDQHGYLP